MEKNTGIVIAHQDRTPDGRQTRNLHFKLDYYSQWYPQMTLLVVEQDERPRLESRHLRPGIRYEFLRDGGPFNPSRCFQKGFELLEASAEFLIFTESDVHLDRENIIANLELCRKYDFVSSFTYLIDLSEADTRKLIEGKELDLAGYERRERENICRGSCFSTRKGMQRVGGWKETGHDREGERQALNVRRRLAVFESPNNALRLSQRERKTE
jgi:hypothetical protein